MPYFHPNKKVNELLIINQTCRMIILCVFIHTRSHRDKLRGRECGSESWSFAVISRISAVWNCLDM